MKTSVVIPAYNGWEYLQANLPAVLKLGADEVIVVDDASTDGTVDNLVKDFPEVKLVKHQMNKRFPMTVNDGFAKAIGEIVILLNQDVHPDKDLLKHTLPNFTNPHVFAVTFNEQNRSWAKEEFKNGFLEYVNGPKDNNVHESAWASGGSAAFRKKMWDELGGFDPIFSPGYSEDHDLGIRARKKGLKIFWDPKCKVQHLTETAFNRTFSPRKLRYIKERNYLLLQWRNLSEKQLSEHRRALADRIIRHPGFIVPTAMAIWKKLVS